jgi:hypothetical protein
LTNRKKSLSSLSNFFGHVKWLKSWLDFVFDSQAGRDPKEEAAAARPLDSEASAVFHPASEEETGPGPVGGPQTGLAGGQSRGAAHWAHTERQGGARLRTNSRQNVSQKRHSNKRGLHYNQGVRLSRELGRVLGFIYSQRAAPFPAEKSAISREMVWFKVRTPLLAGLYVVYEIHPTTFAIIERKKNEALWLPLENINIEKCL